MEKTNDLPKTYYDEENGLYYKLVGDYYIPDLKLMDTDTTPIGKYGSLRRRFLKEQRPGTYSAMLLTEELYPHLREVDKAAQERLEQMMPQLAKEAGATEELKARDQLKWVGLMNACKAQVEEIIMEELVYA